MLHADPTSNPTPSDAAGQHTQTVAKVAAVLERRISNLSLSGRPHLPSGGVSIYASTVDPAIPHLPTTLPPRELHWWNPSEVSVLLLEGVSSVAEAHLRSLGFQVTVAAGALSEDELCDGRLAQVQILGIRSKTKITARVLAAAPRLLAIGCFCIGTNQVDLVTASTKGIPVFNSPYANSRSVAEMTVSNIIALARQLGDRNREMHQGVWNKQARQCYEIRGKTLGIVGYGHIGSQLSVLAEALGMRVVYKDIVPLMPLGSARQVATLDELLQVADFVTLHVPETPDTQHLISTAEFRAMKPGAYLINASRGSVVDMPALVQAMREGRLGGVAIDVFPVEPAKNGPHFVSDLRAFPNVLLSPHIGGSTEEAQQEIGKEVARALCTYLTEGATVGAVNFPALRLRADPSPHTLRIANVHHNVPGVLQKINQLLSQFNINRQSSESRDTVAYMLADVALEPDQVQSQLQAIYAGISAMPENILTRVFY